MAIRYLYQFGIVMVLFFYNVTDAVWTLTGSSEFAVTNENFVLTCIPDNNGVAIIWRRSVTTIAAIEYNNRCDIQNPDPQYQFTCEPGPVYKLTIPANLMTNSQNNIVWKCESPFGGVGNNAKYTLEIAVTVSSVSVQGNSGYPAVNVIYENTPKTFTCVTNGCRPKANISVVTTGVTEVQRTERQDTQSDGLIVTTVAQTITASRGDSLKTFQCFAVNVQGRQPVISHILTLEVFYIPSLEPTLSGYTTGTVLYEGDNNLTITCQQYGGYPLSVITWLCIGQTGTHNSSGTVGSSYIKLTGNRNINKKTCTCTVRHRYITTYTRTKSVTFTVYYPPVVTVTLQNTTENATNVVFTCNAADGFPTNYTYHGWNQYIGNTRVRSYTDFNEMLSESNRKLTVPKVTFEDTGIYYCSVENGFHGRKPDILQQGSSYFDVRASAKFEPKEVRKPGELHKNLTVNIKFYSNPPALMSGIKWINKTSRNPITDSDNISLKIMSTAMQKTVYGKVVTLIGQTAILTIAKLESFHLGLYQLKIENGGNLSSSFDFEIITPAKPEPPKNLIVYETEHNSVSLTWERGYDGGYRQTFVILVEDLESNSVKEMLVNDDEKNNSLSSKIEDLLPSTTYHIKIYAMNEYGNSSFLPVVVLVRKILKVALSESSNGNAPVITTSVIIVILCIAIIVFAIITWRRGHCTSMKDIGSKGVEKSEVGPYYEGISQNQETNLYEGIQTEPENQSQRGVDTYESLEARVALDVNTENAHQSLQKTDNQEYQSKSGGENTYESLEKRETLDVNSENSYQSLQKTDRPGSGGISMELYENTKSTS